MVELEGGELQLQVQAAFCADKHASARALAQRARAHASSLTRNRLQVKLGAGLIVAVDVQEGGGFVPGVLQEEVT